MIEVPINQIRYDKQLRYPTLKNVIDMSKDIESRGLLHNPIVRKLNDHYSLIDGYLRIEAVKMLGWTSINCEVVND